MSGLLSHLVGFGAALRDRGVRVSLSDEMDAALALGLVDVGDVDEVRLALLTALKIRPGDRAAFDMLFDQLWLARHGQRPGQDTGRVLRSAAPQAPRLRVATAASGEAPAGEPPGGGVPGYSPEAQLRKKAFDALDPH